jgi:ferredoxin-NADP reductase
LAAADGRGQSGNAGLAASTEPPPAWQGFRSLRVDDIAQESADVRSFVLATEDRSTLPAAVPGQFLVLRLEPGQGQAALTRSYSISGSGDNGGYRISVKRADGAGSRYLHDRIRVGDVLQVSAPRGSFRLAPGTGPVVFMSAGIGATPVLAMLRWLADAHETPPRDIFWIYGARCGTEHPFVTEARALLATLPHARSFIAYSKPGQNDQMGRDYDTQGHLNLAAVEPLRLPRQADFYLCGPAAFLAQISESLRAWGVSASCIHSEIFGAGPSITPGIASAAIKAPHPPAGEPGSGPAVSFTRSGLTVPWNARFQSLLELAEACDVPVRWSCRSGVCHTCETAIIGGALDYDPQPLDPPAQGSALICCSRALTDVELDL